MKNRLVFVDLLRGWATIIMIEVHVVNAFLLPAIKESAWFKTLNFINGLVAPSFLFVAGFVFVVASQRKLEEFRSFGKAFWKQLVRIGLIWTIGYALHVPFFSFTRTLLETTAVGWLTFYQADILHCIAVGLLIVFVSRILTRNESVYENLLLVAGILFVLVAPLIWDVDFIESVPAPLAAYLNGQHYSLFPLFPWLGFLMLGAYSGAAYLRARAADGEARFVKRVLVIAILLILAGSLLMELPVQLRGVSTAVRANPLFFGVRLGIVLILMVICWYYVQKRQTHTSLVLDVSRESLLVYGAHLLIIYGQYWNGDSLVHWYRGTFTVLECALGTLALTVLMIGFARGWGWLKQHSFSTARILSYASGLIALVIFFVKKT